MNDNKNNEKQFEASGKHRIVIDGIPYTVMVFFQIYTREIGMDKNKGLAKKEITMNPIPE